MNEIQFKILLADMAINLRQAEIKLAEALAEIQKLKVEAAEKEKKQP